MLYLDNAATTKVYDDTADIVKKYLTENFYNPSALYRPSIDVYGDIKGAREGIARILNVTSDEVYFVSSGTEADNTALFNTRKKDGSEIIISSSEHSAIYNTAGELKERGYQIKIAPVDKYGRVIEEEFIKLLSDKTALISIIHVCNETGAINDVAKLSKIAKDYNPNIIFHSDGVQAFTKVPISLKDTNIDLYSISGHKINAPKGIAALIIRKGIKIRPILYGGGQEKNIRSSTENVSGIMAFEYAAQKSILNYAKSYNTMKQLLQFTADLIKQSVKDVIVNTDFDNSAPNILSISFKDIRGEVLMHSLEQYGIYVGIGSACTSKKGTKRIPTALNLPKSYYDGMIRISINPEINKENLEFAVEKIIIEYRNLIKFTRG